VAIALKKPSPIIGNTEALQQLLPHPQNATISPDFREG